MIKIENVSTKLKLEYDFGLNEKGKKIKKTRTYSNLSDKADLEDISDIAKKLSGFSEKRLENTKILKEELVVEEV